MPLTFQSGLVSLGPIPLGMAPNVAVRLAAVRPTAVVRRIKMQMIFVIAV